MVVKFAFGCLCVYVCVHECLLALSTIYCLDMSAIVVVVVGVVAHMSANITVVLLHVRPATPRALSGGQQPCQIHALWDHLA